MLTLQALAYIEGNDQTSGKGANWIASNSTVEKYTPMQVMKQPEYGRTLTTEEQK